MSKFDGTQNKNIGLKKRRKFLIVCEGAKTEPAYFNSFPIDKDVIDIDIQGIGMNTDTLVEEAIDRMEKAPHPYNQVWVVFDRDSFPERRYLRAIKLCDEYGIKFAVTNEAFELWYMLHFNYYDSAMSRTQYEKKISDLIGRKYKKNDPEIYNLLLSRQQQAIKAAKRLRKFQFELRENKNVYLMNPFTTVYELVEELGLHSINHSKVF